MRKYARQVADSDCKVHRNYADEQTRRSCGKWPTGSWLFRLTVDIQSTTVHDGLLHSHFRHCSLAASVVHRLPPAVCTVTPVFNVRSLCLFCSRPGSLELVTRLPVRSVTFLWQFLLGPENFYILVLLLSIRGCANMHYINLLLTIWHWHWQYAQPV